MGPSKELPLVWSKRYDSNKRNIYNNIRLPSGSYSLGKDNKLRNKTTKQKVLFSSEAKLFLRFLAQISNKDTCSNQDRAIHLHNHNQVSCYNKNSEHKRATFCDQFMGIKFSKVCLIPIQMEGKEFFPEDNVKDLMMTEHKRIQIKRHAGLCMFFVCIATVTCTEGVFWRAEHGPIFFLPKNRQIEGLVCLSAGK